MYFPYTRDVLKIIDHLETGGPGFILYYDVTNSTKKGGTNPLDMSVKQVLKSLIRVRDLYKEMLLIYSSEHEPVVWRRFLSVGLFLDFSFVLFVNDET